MNKQPQILHLLGIHLVLGAAEPSVIGNESVLMASGAVASFPSLDPLRLCFSLRRKKDLRAAADRVLLVPLSSFMSAMLCLL